MPQPESAPEPRGERELVRRIARELPPPPAAAVPFGDDMAPLAGRLLWTVDTLMDGVDFDSARHAWRQIGAKAVAANLSDCAAMGATPRSALLSLVLSVSMSMEDALEIVRGARDLAQRYDCDIAGGDTNSWTHPTVISVTIAAEAESGPPILRSGARPGDRLLVSGRLGGSILGRHLEFEPRVELGRRLAREARPSALIDISDGLAIDLSRLCEASGCGARLDAALVQPAIHPDAEALSVRDGVPAFEHALYDGEDFELLAAAPPELEPRLTALGFLPIGEIIASPGLWLVDGSSISPLAVRGWEHFR